MLRSAAPRVLAKTNIFDFIVAVGIGSAFGRVLTAKEVALAEACTAFVLLITLQYGVSKFRFKFAWFAKLTDAEPTLLYFNDQFLPKNLAAVRLTLNDVHEAVRIHGLSSFATIQAIIIEASGDIAIIKKEGTSHSLIDAVVAKSQGSGQT